jgi:hypothetical protein
VLHCRHVIWSPKRIWQVMMESYLHRRLSPILRLSEHMTIGIVFAIATKEKTHSDQMIIGLCLHWLFYVIRAGLNHIHPISKLLSRFSELFNRILCYKNIRHR